MTPINGAQAHSVASGVSNKILSAAARLGIAAPRCEALASQLAHATGLLGRRRAGAIPDGHVDDYVLLGWMAWKGGGLVVTDIGNAINDASVRACV